MGRAKVQTTNARIRSQALMYVVMFAFVLVVGEVLSFVALNLVESVRPGIVLDLFLTNYFASITPESIKEFAGRSYDLELGWDNKPNTVHQNINAAGRPYVASYDADGAREDGLPSKALAVTAYGDSFTAGDEVNNDETWTYFLELALDRGVQNFGTNAYGTDQALMKFEIHARSGIIAPVTVLGIYQENINRIVNRYRPFYTPETSAKLGFKPTYACDPTTDTLSLRPNPLAIFEPDPEVLRQLAEATAGDDAYGKRKIRLAPPYLPKAVEVLVGFARVRLGGESWLAPQSLNLWADATNSHLMACLVRRFVALAEQHGTIPLILMIPDIGRSHHDPPAYADFVERLEIELPRALFVDISKERFDAERFLTAPGGHTSAYGNKVIAEALARKITPLLRLSQRGRSCSARGDRVLVTEGQFGLGWVKARKMSFAGEVSD